MSTSASTGLAWRKVTVTFDGQFVTISRAGLGTSTSRIPVSKITQVRFNAPMGRSGYIEFVSAGTDGRVSFWPWQASRFAVLHNAVALAIA